MFSSKTHQGKENAPLRLAAKENNDPKSTSQPSQLFGSDSRAKHPDKVKLIAPKEPTCMMASGRCNSIVSIGTLTVRCPCVQGIFEVGAEGLRMNPNCVRCHHALIDHESVNISSSVHSKSSCDCFHFLGCLSRLTRFLLII